jgi:hypothetical protein
VCQESVTATLCIEELFLSTHNIQLSPYIRKVNHDGGSLWTVNVTDCTIPAGFHTSQLDLNTVYKVSKCVFLYNYFVTGEDDKDVFLFPAIKLDT